MWKDIKYLIAYLLPLSAFAGIYFKGALSPGAFYVAFVIIPLLEQFLPQSTRNLSTSEEDTQDHKKLFDILLYLNLPILYALLFYYAHTLLHTPLSWFEMAGITLNVGIVTGALGINVGHELGHRHTPHEQWIAKALLLPALYMHFIIEHNRGHHKNVSTELDPASARKGQTLYAFWWQSVTGAYRNAWKLEAQRLARSGKSPYTLANEMVQFSLIQLSWLLSISLLSGAFLLPFAIAIAIIGALLLETVNYIEHYGLRRQRLPSGNYEPVSPRHSWNADHELGRIFLYELTRHSDHHYKSTRKYQVLRHFDESPQLPLGYPASMLTALIPPLWFHIIHPSLNKS
jgi:alkane 1-monooxygenase